MDEEAGASTGVQPATEPLGSKLDRFQSRIVPLAFLWATGKKFLQDLGTRLAAVMAYYTFLSIFPLLVAGFAVLNIILSGRPDDVLKLVQQVVPPAYQQQVIEAYQSLPPGGLTLAIALIGLLLTGTGGVMAFYVMINRVFAVPYRERPGIAARYARVLGLVLLMGVGVLVVAVGSSVLGAVSDVTWVVQLGGIVGLWAVGFVMLYWAAKLLCHRPLGFAELGLGACLGSLIMTVTISLGSSLVARHAEQSSAVYGVFASAVAVISILFIVSNAVVLSFEASAVLAWQLWPRSIDPYLLFPADERALTLVVLTDEIAPTQSNTATFDAQDDDPRRIPAQSLLQRVPGEPRTPYGA